MIKNALTLLVFAFTLSGFSQTQAAMNTSAHDAYQKADGELNTVYQQILKEYKADATFIKTLKNAQRLEVTNGLSNFKIANGEHLLHSFSAGKPLAGR